MVIQTKTAANSNYQTHPAFLPKEPQLQRLPLPTHTAIGGRQVDSATLREIPLFEIPVNHSFMRQKRIFDVAICLLSLPVTLPLMATVALAVRLESEGGVIFRQTRLGRWGKPFTCFKFRSMQIDAEEVKQQLTQHNEVDGPVFKMKRDPRVTRVGRIIRKLSLDELPQIFNVLRGDMSLVGPRPPVPSEVLEYTSYQMQRLQTIPGLTGLQQVSGRSDLEFEQWVAYDLQYVAEQSLRKDIEILLRTVPAVVSGRGAY